MTTRTIIFTEGTFDLAGTDDKRYTILAVLASNGLAYHVTKTSTAMNLKTGTYEYPVEYAVSHSASGLRLCGNKVGPFRSDTQCRAFIERVGSIVDWTQEKPVLTSEVVKRIYAVRQEVEAL